MKNDQIIIAGQNVFDLEIKALSTMKESLSEPFANIVNEIFNCEGKVILTGIGKPSHVAKKISATLSSLGTPSFFLDPSEAAHGDLGVVTKDDIVIAISYSGESDEIISIIPNVKLIGAKLIGISSNSKSTLLKYCDLFEVLPNFEEACHLGLAPTSSTTVEMCYGDALAVVLSRMYHYTEKDFGMRHPAGSLGKKLVLRVKNIMSKGDKNAVLPLKSTLKETIVELSKKGLGIVCFVDDEQKLFGIITDGDLRRQLEKGADIYSLNAIDVLTRSPIKIEENAMAVDALSLMRDKNISCLPVVDSSGFLVGTIRLHDIIARGIIG